MDGRWACNKFLKFPLPLLLSRESLESPSRKKRLTEGQLIRRTTRRTRESKIDFLASPAPVLPQRRRRHGPKNARFVPLINCHKPLQTQYSDPSPERGEVCLQPSPLPTASVILRVLLILRPLSSDVERRISLDEGRACRLLEGRTSLGVRPQGEGAARAGTGRSVRRWRLRRWGGAGGEEAKGRKRRKRTEWRGKDGIRVRGRKREKSRRRREAFSSHPVPRRGERIARGLAGLDPSGCTGRCAESVRGGRGGGKGGGRWRESEFDGRVVRGRRRRESSSRRVRAGRGSSCCGRWRGRGCRFSELAR